VASSGMMVGGLLSYSFLFQFNPVWWLSFFILLTGLLGTARIIICQHTLSEIFVGFLVGMFCGVAGILFI
jgi:membrane-associated phospholipid phosphatase